MLRRFENLVDPYTDTGGQTPPQGLWAFLVYMLWPLRGVLLGATVLTLIVGLIEVWMIFYAGRLVDVLAAAGPEAFWERHGIELIAVGAFLLIARPLIQVLDAGFLNQALMPNVGTLVRWRAHNHVLRQSVGWFQNDFAGRIANRVMQTAPATGEAAYQTFDALVYSLIYMVGAIILLSDTDLRLSGLLLIWAVAYICLIVWTIPRVGRASQAFSDARSAVTGRIVDSYSNIQSVKLFAHTKGELEYAREAIEHARQTFAAEMRIITMMDLGLTILNSVLVVGVVGYAIFLWQGEVATLGAVAAATALVLRLQAMTGWIMWSLSSLFSNLGVIREGMETISQPLALTDAADAQPLALSAGEIVFEGVTHRYGQDGAGLEGVNLTLKPGQKVGLVGRSGAGKSTLVNLILRFFDPETGRITVDGQDIARVPQDSLRAQVGMVTQDTALMHRSVRDNIRYGKPDATEAEVIAAARQAEAHDFIEGLKDPKGRTGYDAEVGERGVKLSGGQRQRIALARVILKDAPILVLDEATSALDSEVEAAIQETLYGVMEGKTVIAIAHRLSTIAHLDRILVLDQGRIVEDGTHAELLAQRGLYAGFWQRQSGGFLGVAAAE